MSEVHEDLGYPPRSQRPTPNAQRPSIPTPKAQRLKPSPSLDPDLLNAPAENDFTRWYDQQCREKNRPNRLERNRT